jgi:hypothetical protein
MGRQTIVGEEKEVKHVENEGLHDKDKREKEDKEKAKEWKEILRQSKMRKGNEF